ncbi:MAG: LuxR C-terminal-related transcriptional regulator, partial [Oscillospiraceae bacterium]|jgi:LuxR family maltose regulon positive regulatory protein|nr:LuxR C-terminal-related transcriptional regulator [Oscillospiraceae bacterium]
VKENIFNFMEKEIFEYSDNEDQKTMVKLSLINSLPPPIQTAITDDMRFLRNNPNLSSLVWYDSFAGDYRMHPIYIEFLQGKQDMLSEEEIRAVYVHAAEWCIHNNFELEAFCFYAKLKNWGAMVQIAVRHMYTIPKSAAEVFVETFDSICGEQDDEYGHLALLCDALTPSFLIILGRNAEAEERTVQAIKKWENSKAPYIPILMFTFYNNLGFLGVYGCPKTHRYDFYKYFKYATEEFYYKINTAGAAPIEMPPSSAILGSYACMVGVGVDKAEIRQFLGAIKETMKYLPLTFNGYYYGYDDFAEAELAYFSSRTGDAKRFALRAIEKAREKKQFEIEAGALMLLLRCAVFEGDYARLSWLLTQLRAMLGNKQFPNRQMFYDLATGWLGAQIGVPSLISSWFTSNDDGNDKSSYKLYKEWAVKLLCLLKNRRYEEILLFEFTADEESSALLFGFISVNLLKAIASLRSGYLEHAVQLLETVYDNSLNGELQMPFIAHGSDMKELAALALKSKSKIPKAWLDSVALKASAYAKKTASIAAMYNKDNGIQESISLTEREIQVLNDLYLGLSRQEIAASRFLSINTVKTIIQTLYVKLGAESNIDAVRIALERKLIGI